jgi:hypothetical protein
MVLELGIPQVQMPVRLDNGHYPIDTTVFTTRELVSGMSGSRVTHVMGPRETFVLKNNIHEPEKIHKEIEGFKKLTGTPIAEHMLMPYGYLRNHNSIFLPFFDGNQMRDAVRQGSVPEARAQQTLDELLEIKKAWWAQQEKQPIQSGYVSMQRAEWADTLLGLSGALGQISDKYGIAVDQLIGLPIQFNDQLYQPFSETLASVAQRLSEDPPYTILAHNDASGANILLDSSSEKWKLIDAEWAGQSDPAESLVRMTKWMSATTMQNNDFDDIRVRRGRIEARGKLEFSPVAAMLQQRGVKAVASFGQSLSDPDFIPRYQDYLAGSYARELSLAQKRGGPDKGFASLILASEAKK